ncbi:Nonribosomal peptide synthetase 8 [Cercospora beticola]|uniref:Nonribosomal peptide synthetase 8 n=1 Tax=Cercospora beticola TaxID=122368 RepID=A0A2G5I0S3_CERBT|nr:Nonribosomal peptide synthetase 8 [Cercospora beticola]PIA98387.1 Nonribosomal peptide synthetase 8 [Cercospora beticola]
MDSSPEMASILLDSDTSSSYEDETGLVLIPKTFPDLLAARSNACPKQLALDSCVRQWTYSQLQRHVAVVADVLQQTGVGPGERVGMCFDLSPWAVVAILASMTLGAAVVPVYPYHAKPRRTTMFREARVRFVIVQDHQYGKDLDDSGYTIIRLMDIDFDAEPRPVINAVSRPEDPAFIAFTSGTTGKPKGIVQTQQAIVTMSTTLARYLNVQDTSRVSQLHPYVFDVSVMEIGMCLATGAMICLTDKGEMMLPSAGEIGPELTKSRITHTTVSPTMLNMMEPAEIPTVRVLSVMGEPLGRNAIEKWASCESRSFYQLWGATEACILQTITTPITKSDRPQNIGYPLLGACRLWIADPSCPDTLLKDGDVGEIVVESRALATEYIGREEETAKAFLGQTKWQDDRSHGRVYRTGDLGRKQNDGSVIFLGRNDNQMNFHDCDRVRERDKGLTEPFSE